MRTVIISCVGQRPLAVITPIKPLIRVKNLQPSQVTICLITTKHTEKMQVEHCGDWLREHYPDITISKHPFVQTEDFVASLCAGFDDVYFNTNSGMNWQISFMCLHLPEKTVCISSDMERLYVWNLLHDAREAEVFALEDMGLTECCRLSTHINVTVLTEMKATLGGSVRKTFAEKGIKTSFDIHFKDKNPQTAITTEINEEINQRLIWVNEQKGQFYLLFDLTLDGVYPQYVKKHIELKQRLRENTDAVRPAYLKDLYRLLTSVFDSVNYNVTIATDQPQLVERAAIDGIDHIRIHKDIARNMALFDFVAGKRHITPKAVIPRRLTESAFRRKGSDLSAPPLLVCLGDNLETTLKAIHAHQPRPILIFFDTTSPKISRLARKLAMVLGEMQPPVNVYLMETDHRGGGILTMLRNIRQPLIANITAGTKMQTVALSCAARLSGNDDGLYSIKGESTTQVARLGGFAIPIPPFPLEEIILPQIARVRDAALKDKSFRNDLWHFILDDLVGKRIEPGTSLLGLKIAGTQYTVFDRDAKTGKLKAPWNEYLYDVSEAFFDERKGGIWWEAVVAQAVHDIITTDVHWQVTWNWSRGSSKRYFSELDVVFSYKNRIFVISCKSGSSISLVRESFLVKSEAAKRFGRQHVPCIAVPFEKHKEKTLTNTRINSVGILTPEILSDRDKFTECLTGLASSLKTSG